MKRQVLFIDLKSYYRSPPYQIGLLICAAKIEPEVAKNVAFTIREVPRDEPVEAVVQEALAANADLIAISCYAWNHKKLCAVLDALARSGQRLPPILVGGPNSVGEFGDALMAEYPSISAMVEGEGEPAFQDICNALVGGATDLFSGARNCVVRDPAGGVSRPNLGHRVQQLDDIPSPYLTGILRAEPSPIFYETNRGCPYRCAFCYWGNGNSKISTGVPSILIHQLYLLPGTAFYENRASLGLEMLSSPPAALAHIDTGGIPWNRSDYWDYTVTCHPKMPRAEQIRGARMQAINHMLHNHALGIVPNFFLGRYGVSHRAAYEAFDDMLLGKLAGFELTDTTLLERLRAVILGFSDNIGLDEYLFYRTISELTWFRPSGDGPARADAQVRELLQAFYRALRGKLGVCTDGWQAKLFEELVDFGLLMAPKPGWSPTGVHEFEFDVQSIWSDVYSEVVTSEPDDVLVDGAVQLRKNRVRALPGEWQQVARQTRERVRQLLTDDYLLGKRQAVTFKARNPWVAPPSKDNCDWLLSSKSKRIDLRPIETAAE